MSWAHGSRGIARHELSWPDDAHSFQGIPAQEINSGGEPHEIALIVVAILAVLLAILAARFLFPRVDTLDVWMLCSFVLGLAVASYCCALLIGV